MVLDIIIFLFRFALAVLIVSLGAGLALVAWIVLKLSKGPPHGDV